MDNKTKEQSRRRKGFTLVEILVAMTVAGMAATALFAFFIFGLRANATTTTTLVHNDYIRNLTQKMLFDIRRADQIIVYKSTSDLTEVGYEQTGDYMLCFYNAWDVTSKSDKVERVVGYYLHNVYGSDEKELYRFENTEISEDNVSDVAVSTFSGFGTSAHDMLASDVEKTTDVDGNEVGIFEYFKGVRVQASFTAPNAQAKDRFTLYNFTAAPRG